MCSLKRLLYGLALLPALAAAAPVSTFTPKVFVYGEIYDHHSEQPPAADGVSAANLVGHLGWLREHGYRVVAARRLGRAGRELRERQVILMFTGTVTHFRDVVYPLLEVFDVPAMLALSQAGLQEPGSGAALRALAASGRIDFALELPAAAAQRVDRFAEYLRAVRAASRDARPDWLLWRDGPFHGGVIEGAKRAGYRGVIAEGPVDYVHPLVLPGHPLRGDPGPGALIGVLAEDDFIHPPLRGIRIPAPAFVDARGRIDEPALGRTAAQLANVEPSAVFAPAFLAGADGRRARILLFPNRTTGNNRSLPELIARLAVPVYAVMPAAVAAEQRKRAAVIFEDLGAHAAIRGVLLDPGVCLGPCPPAAAARDPGTLAGLAGALRRQRRDIEIVWMSSATEEPLPASVVDRFLIRGEGLCERGKASLWRRLGRGGGYDGSILEFDWPGRGGSLLRCLETLRSYGIRHYSLFLPDTKDAFASDLIAEGFSRRTFPYRRNDL